MEHPVKKAILESIREIFANVGSLRDVTAESLAPSCEYIDKSKLEQISLSDGSVQVRLEVPEKYYYQMLSEMAGVQIDGEYQLISMIRELSEKRREYESVQEALNAVHGTGYGVITPQREEIRLEAPALTKQGNRYGVKIKASSPSVHLSGQISKPRSHRLSAVNSRQKT